MALRILSRQELWLVYNHTDQICASDWLMDYIEGSMHEVELK